MAGESPAVAPTALRRFHHDVLRLFEVMAELHARLDEYPIDYGSPRYLLWAETHQFQEWPTDPHAAVIAKRARGALNQALEITGLADSILERKESFFWFVEFVTDNVVPQLEIPRVWFLGRIQSG